jgi:hypothetical protein
VFTGNTPGMGRSPSKQVSPAPRWSLWVCLLTAEMPCSPGSHVLSFVKTGEKFLVCWPCLALVVGKDIIIVFRFIIEYSSLRDFYRPLGNK